MQGTRFSAKMAMLGAVATLLSPVGQAQTDDARNVDGGVSSFYAWTKKVPATPGTLLREEPLPAELALAATAAAKRILYTSTDGVDGKTPVVVSGAYFAPKGMPPKGGWPLIAWAHGTVGIADVCAPSWAGRSDRDVQYLNFWLSQGFAVIASDYQGLGTRGLHPYMVTRPAAYSMLDGIRATLRSQPGLSGKVVIVGQSQGASTAVATAGLAPSYAPKLDIRGTVATGTPYISVKNPTASLPKGDLDRVDPNLSLTFFVLRALQQVRPNVRDADVVTPLAEPVLAQVGRLCRPDLSKAVAAAGLTQRNAMQPGADALFGPLVPLLGYPTLNLKEPLFMGMGTADQLAAPAAQAQLAKDACAAGTIVEAHLYEGLDHSGTVLASTRDSLPFVRKVLKGRPVTPQCAPEPETIPGGVDPGGHV